MLKENALLVKFKYNHYILSFVVLIVSCALILRLIYFELSALPLFMSINIFLFVSFIKRHSC
jgi:hypothetical protein